MAARLAIFHPPGQLGLKANPFGKDVANLQLFRALAQHGGFQRLDVLSVRPTEDAQLREDLLAGSAASTQVAGGSILNSGLIAEAGALLRGQPNLYDLAWQRRRLGGERAYSLLGLVHTIAPPASRQSIAQSMVGPIQPWDAIICTSPSVQEALQRMLAETGDYLAERTGGRPPPGPLLPLLPLGVDAAALAEQADRPQVRGALRARLGVAADEVLVLWVGRLSFFEKAFPQAMFQAVQQAAGQAGVRPHFAMAGWFPGARDREAYQAAAAAYAPDVRLHILDGNDHALVGELWAASDIFLSLVDNLQETFGITPVEAMAAGLPVVVSDWDGYRFTVHDGEQGFLVPTLLGPAEGLGPLMVARHVMEIDTYQGYVGAIAQHTAVHVGRAAAALAQLMADPALRQRMGMAGRARARAVFDWPVVARQFNALVDELAARRAAAADLVVGHRLEPARGDPFRDFAGFASQVLAVDTRLRATGDAESLRRNADIALDHAFASWRASREECAAALAFIAARGEATVREVLLQFPTPRRRAVELGLLWLAKRGLIDWLD